MKNIFIIGSKGIPAKYGGFETFVEKLTENKKNENIKYHVSCLADNNDEFNYNGARCFNVKVKDIGSAKAIIYDIEALKRCVKYIKGNNLKNCSIYILACRIGFFLTLYCKKIAKMEINLYVNPDGHEWKRSKWNRFIKGYWKFSEKLTVKYADLLICDSKKIQCYIKEEYKKYNPNTTYIAYGSDITKSKLSDNGNKLIEWNNKFHIEPFMFYLIVGRFVPENNYQTIIKEFMKSNTNKDLVIISNVEQNKFYEKLLLKTKFNEDKRIKFVGTVYEEQLLKKIRENAYAYIHGHEMGGTNPSLLEALASTKINLLLEVGFNKEVGEEGAVYFNKSQGNLSELINAADYYHEKYIENLSYKAKKRIIDNYSWEKITIEYERLFLK